MGGVAAGRDQLEVASAALPEAGQRVDIVRTGSDSGFKLVAAFRHALKRAEVGSGQQTECRQTEEVLESHARSRYSVIVLPCFPST
jgi:hypothetical protein